MAVLPPPDKARGLFETLLVLDGEPIELDAHLARLSESLETLFDATLPPGLAERAREKAHGSGLGRMRITVRYEGIKCREAFATEAVDPADFFPAWGHGAELRSLLCNGGLGRHKWADRRPLGEANAETVPLLLDRGGEVLEAGRASVFAARGGVLKTPAADGRILPGIARAGAIAAAHEAGIDVVEGPLTQDQLLAADEVFLTGSVRGVEPARSLDGAPLGRAGELSRRVGDCLRRRWLPTPSAASAPVPATAPRPGLPVR